MSLSAVRQGASLLCLTVLLGVGLAGCSTSPSTPTPASTGSATQDCTRSKSWETWLLSDGSTSPDFCSQSPNDAFCEISKQRPELQKQYMAWRKMRLTSPSLPKSRAVRPRFSQSGKLQNLEALQKASVSSIIRGLSKATRRHLKTLTEEAKNSPRCSNALFLSLGSAWENFLPKADLQLIGDLYERAANCSTSDTEDVINTRFRGGLFFYAAGDYAHSRDLFEKAASQASSTRARSLFWLYRSELRLGNTSKANGAIDKLEDLHPTSFHGLLGQKMAGRDNGIRDSSRWWKERLSNPPLLNTVVEAIEKLQACNCFPGSIVLNNWAIGLTPSGSDPKFLLYLAKLRDVAGENPVKIAVTADAITADPSLVNRQTLELFYPRPFWQEFDAQKGVIDPYFLLAVARQESAFDPGAVSGAKAVGLLQLIPSTARRFKRKINLRSPKDNVEVGARYMTQLIKASEGKVFSALASYNAGPGKIRLWMGRYQIEDAILFVDLIPYRETREYVAAVLRNYYWYRTLYTQVSDSAPVVQGAFPVDADAVAQLRGASTPAPVAERKAPEPTPTQAQTPVGSQGEKSVAVKPKPAAKPIPEVAKAPPEKAKPTEAEGTPKPEEPTEVSSGEARRSEVPDLKTGEEVDSDDQQLPDEISIAPEIDKSPPQ